MSFKYTNLVKGLKYKFHPSEKSVLRELADYCDKHNGHCFPSINRLAEDCSIHRMTVIRAIKSLEKNGFITKYKVTSQKNGYERNNYKLNIAKLEMHQRPVKQKEKPVKNTVDKPVNNSTPSNMMLPKKSNTVLPPPSNMVLPDPSSQIRLYNHQYEEQQDEHYISTVVVKLIQDLEVCPKDATNWVKQYGPAAIDGKISEMKQVEFATKRKIRNRGAYLRAMIEGRQATG